MSNILKHIHAQVGFYNGSLYFLVDSRLLRVGVNTAHFNDYGEWRLNGFYMSKELYNPDDNKVELKPYESFKDIELDDETLEFINSIPSSDDENEDTWNKFFKNYPDYNPDLAGGILDTTKRFTVFSDKLDDDMSVSERTLVDFDEWESRTNKTPFEKLAYPLLKEFRNGFVSDRNSKSPEVYI